MPTNFSEVKEEVKRNKEGYSTKLIQKKNKKYHNLKYKGNRRAGNKNNRMAIVTNHTTNMQPNLEPRPSYSQVLQTPQPTYQPKPPPPRRETDVHISTKDKDDRSPIKTTQPLTLEASHK